MKHWIALTVSFWSVNIVARGAGQGVLESGYVAERHVVDTGALVSRLTTTNTYDRAGNLVRTVTMWDWNGDANVDESDTTTWVYGNGGRLLFSTQEIDFGNDGTIDWRAVTTTTNVLPNETVEFTSVDWNADGIVDYIATTTTTFDKQNNPLLMAQENDFGADGTVDERIVTSWEYDYQRNQTVIHSESDFDGDGTPDYIYTETVSLNNRGQPVSGITEVLFDPLSASPYTIITNSRYDKTGNLLLLTFDYVLPTPGGPVHYLETVTGSYLKRNELISKLPALRPLNRLAKQ